MNYREGSKQTAGESSNDFDVNTGDTFFSVNICFEFLLPFCTGKKYLYSTTGSCAGVHHRTTGADKVKPNKYNR